jgi:prepilin-type N-terminal cleavage/methylation domain-containing protein
MLVKLNKYSGFTLVEMAMVLFIIGLLLGGLLVPLSTKLEQDRRDRTEVSLNDIKEALLGFAVINGRLPCADCPDGTVGTCSAVAAANRNDGIGDWSGTVGSRTCNTAVGNLPWVDLQVPAFDAWNHYYTYQVTSEFSRESNTAACGTPSFNVSFEICTAGDIDIYDNYTVPPYSGTPTVADNAPVVVISYGSDMYEPAQTVQQVENYGRDPVNPDIGVDILSSYTATDYVDNIFIYRDFERDTSVNPPTQFDDMIIWISPNLLMNRMIKSGSLP